jgi:hypothetical protein
MQDSVSKAERYRKEASKYAELAKDAQPAYLADVYRKVAVRYVFMAEELLKGPSRDGDAIERADRMISRPIPPSLAKPKEARRRAFDGQYQFHHGIMGGSKPSRV